MKQRKGENVSKTSNINEKMKEEINQNGENSNTISEARKKQLINLTVLILRNLKNLKKESIIQSVGATEQEEKFVQEVYEEIKGLGREGYLTIAEKEALKATLFQKFGISQQEEKAIEGNFRESLREDSKGENASKEREDSNKISKADLREDLYEAGGLSGEVKLRILKPENRITHPTYQFANKEYTITKTGDLQYVTVQNVTEQISQYEIIVKEGEKTYITRAFGTILFNMMDNRAYRNGMFLGLLHDTRLKAPEMHGYIGALVPRKDEDGKTQYVVQYRAEEYTAVIELENARGKKRNNVTSINDIKNNKQREAGGEGR